MPSHYPVFIDGVRTPFQKAGTGFQSTNSHYLGASAIKSLLKKTGVSKEDINYVIMSTTVHHLQTSNIARECTLLAGLPPSVVAYTVSAGGSSAAIAISQAQHLIRNGIADCVIAGGTDCISDAPIGYKKEMRHKLFKARKLKTMGERLRFLLSLKLWDFLPEIPSITELSTGLTMGEYTERLAKKLSIPRHEQDRYTYESHQKATSALEQIRIKKEILPITLPSKTSITEDNGIRKKITLSDLERLSPVFDKKSGTLTAGNSSFLTDGAAVVLMTSEKKAKELGLLPKAKIIDEVFTAHDPHQDLLIGPVFSTQKILVRNSLNTNHIGVFEYHEAFAAQILAVLQCMDSTHFAKERLGLSRKIGTIPRDKLNSWGGSLAIGNPFSPNYARLMTTAVNRLEVEKQEFGLVGTCSGGGFGYTMLIKPLTPSSTLA